MLNDISVLVVQQGEMIDDIEVNLLTAQDYIKKTNKVLEETKKKQQTNRKVSEILFFDHVIAIFNKTCPFFFFGQKLCCIIFLGLATLALILAPFVIKAIG